MNGFKGYVALQFLDNKKAGTLKKYLDFRRLPDGAKLSKSTVKGEILIRLEPNSKAEAARVLAIVDHELSNYLLSGPDAYGFKAVAYGA